MTLSLVPVESAAQTPGAPAPAPRLPAPRGPLSAYLVRRLTDPPGPLRHVPPVVTPAQGEDLHLSLYICYELHYRSFAGVDDGWEWEPELLAFRSRLEAVFEAELDRLAAGPALRRPVEQELWALARGGDGPSLSTYMAEQGTLAQLRELAAHRSAYQLKEADPHTWGLPRLTGGAKAAMAAIQADEYGSGREEAMHSALFAETMAALGLDTTYGAYLDHIPAATLATVNLISLFGLHRRHRAALVGHLALFEMTSIGPMGRYSEALRRLGVPARARRFYDVHVVADATHQLVAARDMAGRLATDEPDLAPGIVFGARALVAVEARFTRHVLGAWAEGRSSLRKVAGGGL